MVATRLRFGEGTIVRPVGVGTAAAELSAEIPDSHGVAARAILAAMVSPVARDLTDPAENQTVLDCASAHAAGEMTIEEIALAHGPAVAAEAEAVCRSRARLIAARVPCT